MALPKRNVLSAIEQDFSRNQQRRGRGWNTKPTGKPSTYAGGELRKLVQPTQTPSPRGHRQKSEPLHLQPLRLLRVQLTLIQCAITDHFSNVHPSC